MQGDADIAAAAALLAEPARAALVTAVIADGALPVTDLADRARIAPSTASEHLRRLVAGGFLNSEKRGRHRYYGLADPAVAAAVEALALVAPQPPVRSLREATRSELLRDARTCYDHLAGRIGVALAQSLERQRVLVRRNGDYALGPQAGARLGALGVDLAALERPRRPVVRGCLDWSEREFHVAGALGAALADRFFELGWIRRREGNRSVEVTARAARASRTSWASITPDAPYVVGGKRFRCDPDALLRAAVEAFCDRKGGPDDSDQGRGSRVSEPSARGSHRRLAHAKPRKQCRLRALARPRVRGLRGQPERRRGRGRPAYHSLSIIPGGVEAVVIGTRPEIAEDTMRECADLGIKHVWMHRGPGAGSVSKARPRMAVSMASP